MAYYNTCPYCGSSLDPGERCNCMQERAKELEFYSTHLRTEPKAGQFSFVFDNREGQNESKKYC